MVRFKDVKIDPWLQRQEKYRDYKKIPEDATFACSYFVFMNPIETVESAFLRRTKKKDELWVASWNYEFSGDLADYSKREQFDSFGCTVVAPGVVKKTMPLKYYWSTFFVPGLDSCGLPISSKVGL